MRVELKKFVAVILIMFNIVFKMEIYFLFLYSTKVFILILRLGQKFLKKKVQVITKIIKKIVKIQF